MKKYTFLLFAFVTIAFNAEAHIPVKEPVSRLYWANPYIFNPAAGSLFQKREANLNYRYDPLFNGINLTANYAQTYKERHAFGFNTGLTGFTDPRHIYKQKYFSLSYAYIIDLKNDAELRLGISPKIVNHEILNKDPLIGSEWSTQNFNIFTTDAGFSFRQKNFYAGYSVTNIFDDDIDNKVKSGAIQPAGYFTASYKIPIIGEKLHIQPSMLIYGTFNTYYYTVDFNTSFILFNAVTAGASYRNNIQENKGKSVNGNIAVKLRKFTLGLSSEIYIEDHENYNKGAEVLLTYTF